jgi:hypothetical protein
MSRRDKKYAISFLHIIIFALNLPTIMLIPLKLKDHLMKYLGHLGKDFLFRWADKMGIS